MEPDSLGGWPGDEKLRDVLHDLDEPSLTHLIRDVQNKVLVQTFGINATKRRKRKSVHAARQEHSVSSA